jgi:F0F1-type ATP synthase membrane subunit c/vacuolar-type H+-ATPase subunit K
MTEEKSLLHSRPHQVVFAGLTVATLAPVALGVGILVADAWRAVTRRGAGA